MKNLRFWYNDFHTVDLCEVVAISNTGYSGLGDRKVWYYTVAFKGGATIKVEGHELNAQFRKYHQLQTSSECVTQKE